PGTDHQPDHFNVIDASERKPGDMIFWPGHVAIYAGDGMLIESLTPGYTVHEVPVDQRVNNLGEPTYYALKSEYVPPTGPYADVTEDHPFHDEILWATDEGITGGYSDGTFRPTNAVSRQAAAAFLY